MAKDCKRCLLLESSQEDMLDLIKDKIKKISPEEKVSEEEYKTRLAHCMKCEYLVSGTCFKCGCYVEFRAAFKGQSCPDAGNRKW